MSTFYVTPAERTMLGSLPSALTEGWSSRLQDETLDAYETQEQLSERMASVSYDAFPAAKALAEKVRESLKAGDLQSVSFAGFPSEAMPTLLFSIGACGIEALIEISLRDPPLLDARAMEAVAALSRVRHHILEQNAVHAA